MGASVPKKPDTAGFGAPIPPAHGRRSWPPRARAALLDARTTRVRRWAGSRRGSPARRLVILRHGAPVGAEDPIGILLLLWVLLGNNIFGPG